MKVEEKKKKRKRNFFRILSSENVVVIAYGYRSLAHANVLHAAIIISSFLALSAVIFYFFVKGLYLNHIITRQTDEKNSYKKLGVGGVE